MKEEDLESIFGWPWQWQPYIWFWEAQFCGRAASSLSERKVGICRSPPSNALPCQCKAVYVKYHFFTEIQMREQEGWKPCFDGRGDLGGQTSVLIGHSGFWLRANYKILSSTKPRKDSRTFQKCLSLYSWDMNWIPWSSFESLKVYDVPIFQKGFVWFCQNTWFSDDSWINCPDHAQVLMNVVCMEIKISELTAVIISIIIIITMGKTICW